MVLDYDSVESYDKNYVVAMRRRKHQIMLISRRNFMVFAWKDTDSTTSHLNDFDALWSQLQAQKMSMFLLIMHIANLVGNILHYC